MTDNASGKAGFITALYIVFTPIFGVILKRRIPKIIALTANAVAQGYLRDYFGKEVTVPIYIEIDDGERLARALKRERKPENQKYEEMCRRFLTDTADFLCNLKLRKPYFF